MGGINMRSQQTMDHDRYVFSGRDQCFKFLRIHIQVAVVEFFQHFAVDDIRQHFQINHIAGCRVRHTHNFHHQLIIVPVVMRVAALAKHGPVLLIGPLTAVQAVRRIEVLFSENSHFLSHPAKLHGNTTFVHKAKHMHCLLVAATAAEIAPFTDHLSATDKLDHIELDIDILITGVGLLAATYALTRYLQYQRPDLVIQAGVGGLFNREKPLGTVYAVKKEAVADQGVTENKSLLSLFDMMLLAPSETPYQKKWLTNPDATLLKRVKLPLANGITVNEVTTSKNRIQWYQEQYKATVESMEGAALHYACLQENIGFLQLRAASNYVGERNKKKWQMTEAIQQLNAKLIQLLENL